MTLLRPLSSDMSAYPDSGFFAQFTSQSGPYAYQGRLLQPSDGSAPNSDADNEATRRFPFFSQEVSIDPPPPPMSWGLDRSGNYVELRPVTTPGTFRFLGGNVTLRIFSGTTNAMPPPADAVQTYTLNFPEADVPIPQIIRPVFTSSDNIRSDVTDPSPPNDPKTLKFYCGFDDSPMDGRNFESRLTASAPNTTVPGGFTRLILWRGDAVRALQWNPQGPSKADARGISGLPNVPSEDFAPHPDYDDPGVLQAHGIAVRRSAAVSNVASMSSLGYYPGRVGENPHGWLRNRPGQVTRGRLVSSLSYNDPTGQQWIRPYVPAAMDDALIEGTVPGDWNTGVGNIYDGAFINKADEGFVRSASNLFQNIYFQANLGQPGNATLVSYSPTRQIPSPVLFGSLTRGPWRTLLFCPNPAAGPAHPGSGQGSPDTLPPFANRAPDHLYLDHFYMPIAEPYAITEPSSTDGKINLNVQVAPFLHIERTTGIHALVRALRIAALGNGLASAYKREFSSDEAPNNPSWRFEVDAEATVAGMLNRRFGNGTGSDAQGFRSASEVTTIFLVPKTNASGIPGPSGTTPLERYNNTAAWWNDKLLTGDNLRESPYGHLYSRVTTKSNTFTVFYRVQALKQVPRSADADWALWREDRDLVLADLRGDTTIERYIDPNDTNLPDFADPNNTNRNLAAFYRWRTLRQRQFQP